MESAPLVTITHTRRILADPASRHTETHTHTRTVTVTLAGDLASLPLPSLSLPPPMPHGVIPGSPRSQTVPTTTPRRSIYPRPSPPGFLYPTAIVPRAAYETQHGNMSVAPSNALPYGLDRLILGAVLLGLAWTLVAVLVNFPPGTWGKKKKMERRPLDKPARYEHLYRSWSAGKREDTEEPPRDEAAQATTSSAQRGPMHRREQGIEVRKRQTPTHARAQPTAAVRFALPEEPPRGSSPPNPFIRPPKNATTMASVPPATPEWLAGHAAFFSSAASSTSSDDYDVSALEAGTAPLTPRPLKAHEREGSWVDLSFGCVEDAVSGLVGRVVRWTDEDGDRSGSGNEGMVLPVVNGREGVVRA
jgi:hypothetical protein